MIVHDLKGCAPTPLAHYLKALGILRLVAEQADPEVRGWWEGERFRMAARLDRRELEGFFLNSYEPTPIFNPWGGRSGFFPGSSEKSARNLLNAIENTSDPRFRTYQETVAVVRGIIEARTDGTKPEGDDKEILINALRRTVRGKSSFWMDAVTSVVGSGSGLEVEQPALFGTGGNEGSGSYTSAYMAAIEQCLLRCMWHHALPTVLFGEARLPHCEWGQSFGQFLPEGNATPWDFLLAIEGACLVRSAVSSRNTTDSGRWSSSPFYVAPSSYGYPSEARFDEYALKSGRVLPGRGEQWFPLWAQPMSYREISQLFVEARASTKRRRASDGYSMIRAISSFGVRQGLREFVRYGFLQRNNLATHFAVPLGRYRVPTRSSFKLACLDDLDSWLATLRRQARAKRAPDRLYLTERRLSDALLAVSQQPDEPHRWQSVLLAMSEVENILRTGSGWKAGPIPSLCPDWITAADDGTTEFRLALACALQAAKFSGNGTPYDPVRRHWLPLEGNRFATTGSGSQARIRPDTGVVLTGRRGIDDAIALVGRRLVEAAQRGERRFPLAATRRASAHPADLARLVAGEVDLDRTMQLARSLMAIDSRQWASKPYQPLPPVDDAYPDDAWLAIRLALLPFSLPDGQRIGADPAIIRRLESGEASTAVKVALQRLRAAGIKATVRVAAASQETARLWGAALAFPITLTTAVSFLRRLETNSLLRRR